MNVRKVCRTGATSTCATIAVAFTFLMSVVAEAAPQCDPPWIVSDPVDQSVCVNGQATFSVVADGSAPLIYQWHKDGIEIMGATSDTLVIDPVAAVDEGAYDVVVTNACGMATSLAALLTVIEAPPITEHPADALVCDGGAVTFTVIAAGTNLTYQWRKDAAPIPGATLDTFMIDPVSAPDAGVYDVVVSNGCAATTSDAATLTVEGSPIITRDPAGQGACAGGALNLSVEATGGGAEVVEEIGSTTNFGIAAGMRGNVYSITTTATLTRIEQYLDISTPGELVFFVYEATSESGPYTLAVEDRLASSGTGTGFFASNPLNLRLEAGRFYLVGAAWPDVHAYYFGGAHPEPTAFGESRVGYFAAYSDPLPSNPLPASPLVFAQRLTTRPTSLTYQWRKDAVAIPNAVDPMFSIDPVGPADAGEYDVVVTGLCGVAVSLPATVTVESAPPAITTHPSGRNACAGERVVFTVAATGENLSYEWRRNDVPIGGENGTTLTFDPVSPADAGSYDVVVSNGCGSITSDAATLSVSSQAPAITLHPEDQNVCEGQPATFSVTATGDNLTYQWRKDGDELPGETNPSYTIDPVSPADAGFYDVVVANGCGSETSLFATLTVLDNTPPTITQQPQSQSACEGAGVTFSVAAGGSNLSYQWRKDGVDISGATGSSHTIDPVGPADAGVYDVLVTTGCASVTSDPATLTVNVAPAITQHPSDRRTCAGDAVLFSVVATGSPPPSYQWRKDNIEIAGAVSATYTIDPVRVEDAGVYDVVVTNVCGSDTSLPAELIVTTGPPITQQPQDAAVCEGDPVSFDVAALGTGLTYQWRKDAVDIPGAVSETYAISATIPADAGSYDVVVTSNECGSTISDAAVLTVGAGPAITQQPLGQTLCEGGVVTLSVVATGGSGGPGVTDTIGTASIFTTASRMRGNSYAVDTTATLTQIEQYLGITVSGPLTFFAYEADFENGPYTLITSDTVADPGTGERFFASGPLSVTLSAGKFYIIGAAWPDPHSYFWGGNHPQPTAFGESLNGYLASYQNPLPQLLADPVPTSELVYHQRLTTRASSLAYQWRKDDQNIAGATRATHVIDPATPADSGDYNVIVTDACGTVSSNLATVLVGATPQITQQPADDDACVGESVTFSVVADSFETPTYQWRKDGNDIGGATGDSYTLVAVTPLDAGAYDVQLTNTCGTQTSDAALLTVSDTPPTITQQPRGQAACEGQMITLSVAASGSSLRYQWRKDGIDITGATGDTYTIAAATPADAGDYTVVVSNGCGSETSTSAIVTVTTTPTITQQPVGGNLCTGQSFTLDVVATGGPSLTYQWRQDGIDIAGATSAALVLDPVTLQHAGVYDVVVDSGCGSVTSDAVTLTVGGNIPSITRQPVDQTVCEGSPVSFTVEASAGSGGEAVDTVGTTANSSTASLLRGNYYTVTAATTLTRIEPYLDVTASGPIVFFVYEADVSGGPYTLIAQDTVSDPSVGEAFHASGPLSVPLVEGKFYIIGAGWSGQYKYFWGGSHPQTTSFGRTTAGFPSSFRDPLPPTAPLNSTNLVFHQRITTSNATLNYQWRKDGVDISGATEPTYTIHPVLPADAGVYDAVLTNNCGSLPSDPATLTVEQDPEITQQPASRSVVEGSPVTFSVGVAQSGTITNRESIGSATGQDTGPRIRGNSYAVTTPAMLKRVEHYLDITTSDPITFFVYEADAVDGPYTLIASDTNTDPGTGEGFFASGPLDVALVVGTFYIIGAAWPGDHTYFWGGSHPQTTAFGTSLNGYRQTYQSPLPTDPDATSPLVYHQRLTTDTPSPIYQWRKDGVDIAGAVADTYTIASVTTADAGVYDVVVTNRCNAVTSASATLTVHTLGNVGSNATEVVPRSVTRVPPPP